MKHSRSLASQKRVAMEAGVSQSTVSLVLAGRKVNSEDTARRVLAAAEKLGYRPNLLVRGIQTGKTGTVGVLIHPFQFYWGEVLCGIHDVLTERDCVPITLWTAHWGTAPRNRFGPGEALAQIHQLVDRRVDGVILWPPFAQLYQEHLHEFSSRNLPVVTIDHQLPEHFNADYVGSDEASGGRMVAEHLYGLGHRRIGHLAAPGGTTWAHDRRKAFEEAIEKMKGACVMVLEAPGGIPKLGIEPARQMLSGPNRPTAIFTASDLYAKVVYQAAREKGLRIPEDLSVVGFSDDDFSEELLPPLTTVHQPAYEIGKLAAEIVLGRSSGKIKGKGKREELAVELIVRGSTGEVRG
jgi:LacI family transcriptional regulator